MEKNKPIQKFKAGAIEVSVWENNQKTREGDIVMHSVKLERKYKDSDGQWNSCSNFRLNDIPKAVLVLEEAYKFLAMQKHEESE